MSKVDLLPDFASRPVTVDGNQIYAVVGGNGPPVLMLHGDPQTHLMWHKVAPALADLFTIVLTDLRGRGASHKPSSTPTSAAYSKRAHADEHVAVMEALGFESFNIVGHDRGARVARRLALDHPARVERLAVMDIVPAFDLYQNVTAAAAQDYFYFFFLTQPAPLPEDLISGSPISFFTEILTSHSAGHDVFHPDALAAYLDSATTAESIAAMCECFRAGYSIDRLHDARDIEHGRKIQCPTLVMWGTDGSVGTHFDVAEIWTRWADDVTLAPLPCGHFIPEEAPADTIRHLRGFLTR